MALLNINCLALCTLTLSGLVAGRLVHETLRLTWELGAPNGQMRHIIKMNGQFPGPNYVWEEDDDVEVVVQNQMPFNSSVHWHGLMMQDTPWSDGTPGMTQKPIEPDEMFVYRFKASPAGTHWYHSHSRTTLLDGLYGGIFIRPRRNAPAPWALISENAADQQAMATAATDPSLVLVSDWSHFKSWEYIEAEDAAGFTIFILVNGKGSVYCPGEDFLVNQTSSYMKWALYPSHVNDKGCFPFMKSTEGPFLWQGRPEAIPLHLQKDCVPSKGEQAVIDVDPADQWVSFNFIDAATFKTIIVSIDEHPMWVYEVDGQFIEPQKVDTVRMYAGERYAVMVKLDRKPQNYTIRVADSGLTQIISSYTTLRYTNTNRNGQQDSDQTNSRGVINYGGQNTSAVVTLDREHLPPFPPHKPAAHSDVHYVLHTHRWFSPWQYTMSGGGMYQEDRSAYTPLLYDPHQPDALNESLVIRTKNGSWVDLVLQVGSLPDQPQEFPHIIHKHTGKVWQIGEGEGIWNYSTVDEAISSEPHRFNLDNPNFRDTYITSFDGPSWLVLRYQVVNPGPWLFHCHIETHLAGGMAVAILDGIDAWPEVPPEYGPDQKGFPGGGGGGPKAGIEAFAHSDLDQGKFYERPGGSTQANQYYTQSWNSILQRMIKFLETLKSKLGVNM